MAYPSGVLAEKNIGIIWKAYVNCSLERFSNEAINSIKTSI